MYILSYATTEHATADGRASLDSGHPGRLVELLHSGGLDEDHEEDKDNTVITARKLAFLLLK